MKEFFKYKRFREPTLQLIAVCNQILDKYSQQGFDLTLRQLYYQLVSKDLVENSQKSYTRLGDVVSDARLAGLLDWDMIVDRGRGTRANTHWKSPQQILNATVSSFYTRRWANQPVHIEVMIEKQALEGVVIPACRKLDVNFTANKGYSSQSYMYRKGKEFERLSGEEGKEIVVLYLGDHDPSGLDMDRDILERLSMFSSSRIKVERLALLYAQIQQYTPPPNPAKVKDTRARKYIMQFGRVSWELDALTPQVLDQLVTSAVLHYRDDDLWEEALEKEEELRGQLKAHVKTFKPKKV